MHLRWIFILIMAALLLGACGRKGPVKPKPATSQNLLIQTSTEPELPA